MQIPLMRKTSFVWVLFLAVLFCFPSCRAYKNLYYLEGAPMLEKEYLEMTKGVHEAIIKPSDILSITVNSEIKGAAEDFNLPMIPTNSNLAVRTQVVASSHTSGTLQNYLVDKEGTINFPVLGTLKLAGMTIQQAQEHIAGAISPQYIGTKPIVNVRQLNFQVSVLGEVKNPGIYKVENGQMTILDALAAAGDMTIYGKRDNVLLVRIQDDGELAFHKIDLRDKHFVLNKDLFYLQQSDKIYVQPNRARGNSSSFGTLETITLSALSVLISIIAIATR